MFRSSSLALVAVVAAVSTCEAADVLRQGSRGQAVRQVQSMLVSHGHRISVDGIYGPNTASAVRAFQRARGLPATGRVDDATRSALGRRLQRGDRGASVRALQQELREAGYRITVDGIYGPNTEAAVRAATERGVRLRSLSPSTSTAGASTETRAPSGGAASAPANASARVRGLIAEAERVLASNRSGFRQDLFVVVDLAAPSNRDRFFVIQRQGNRSEGYFTSHGSGSDPSHSGYARRFSNTSNSHMTSVGVYRTAETYTGKHGYSLRLDGLSGTNSRARARAIVIHPADYVREGSHAGRSWGCFALDPRLSRRVIDQIKGGALLYAPDPNR